MQVYKSSFFFFFSFSFSFSFSNLQKMSLRSKITIKDTIVDILDHDSDQCDHLWPVVTRCDQLWPYVTFWPDYTKP